MMSPTCQSAPRLVAMLLITVVVGLAGLSARAADLVRSDTGEPIAADRLADHIGASSLYLRSAEAGTFDLFGRDLELAAGTTALLGSTSQALFVACLEGKVSSGGIAAGPGKTLFWTRAGRSPQAAPFHVARFLASAPKGLSRTQQAALADIAARQERLIFWGVLQKTVVNLQSLGEPSLEPVRRSYLNTPEALDLRWRNAEAEDLAQATVEAFLAALASGEATRIEALLPPTSFLGRGGHLADGNWRAPRRAFADRLAGEDWSTTLAGAEVTKGETALQWTVNGNGGRYDVRLVALDDALFVAAFTLTSGAP